MRSTRASGAIVVWLALGALSPRSDAQPYTVFPTSQWMVALDEPSARATLRLRLTLPRQWIGAASGREVSRREISADKSLMEWHQERPVPTYTFGFAVGAFSDVTERAAGVTLRYLGRGVSAADLRRIFDESDQMIAFSNSVLASPIPDIRTHRRWSRGLQAKRWLGSPSFRRSTAARSWPIHQRLG